MRRNANAKLIKQINTSTLLKRIRTHGPISRAELVKSTSLSPTTVSVLVDELIQEKLVKEIGTGESSGGRRPILLTFEPMSRLALGIDIGVRKTSVGLMDLEGSIISSIQYEPDLTNRETFLRGIVHHTTAVLNANTEHRPNILGIGVATPGLLDRERETIVYSSSLGLTDVPLYDTLTHHFSLPIRIDNDMNAAALGEKLMGAGQKIKDLIYVSVETGIGAGIIIDNQIYGGAFGNAGEFGHTTVEPNGAQCKCGNKGCLGVMAAEPALLSRAMHLLAMGANTAMRSLLDGNISQVSLDIIVQAAEKGDPVALSVVNDCMDYLAIGIANLINMFDPAAIILGGNTIETLGSLAVDRIAQTVRTRVLPSHDRRPLTIIPGQLKNRVKLVGAGTLIFSEFLQYVEVLAKEA